MTVFEIAGIQELMGIAADHSRELRSLWRAVIEPTLTSERYDVIARHLCVDRNDVTEVVDLALDRRPWAVPGQTYPDPPNKWKRQKRPPGVHLEWDVLASIFEVRPVATPFAALSAPLYRENDDGHRSLRWSWKYQHRPLLAVDIDTHEGLDSDSIRERVSRLAQALGTEPLFGQFSPGGAWFYWRLSIPLSLEEQRRLVIRRLGVTKLRDTRVEIPEVPRMPLGNVLFDGNLTPCFQELLQPCIRATFRKGAELQRVGDLTRIQHENYYRDGGIYTELPFRCGAFLDFAWAVEAPTVHLGLDELEYLRYDVAPTERRRHTATRTKAAHHDRASFSWVPERWRLGITGHGESNVATRDLTRAFKNAFPLAADEVVENEVLDHLESRSQGLAHSNHSVEELRGMVRSWAIGWTPPPQGVRANRPSPLQVRISEADIAPIATCVLSANSSLLLSAMVRFAKSWGRPTTDGWIFTVGLRHLQCSMGRKRRSSGTVTKALRELHALRTPDGLLLEIDRKGRRGTNTQWRLRLPLISGGNFRTVDEARGLPSADEDPMQWMDELNYKTPPDSRQEP